MAKIQSSLILFVISVLYPIAANADCGLRFFEPKPLLVRNVGSRKVLQNNPSDMVLKIGERVELYCSNNLIVSWYQHWLDEEDNVQAATVECDSRGLFIRNHTKLNFYPDPSMEIKCSTKLVKLYESNETLPNCAGYLSYGIGIKSFEDRPLTTGICYDFDNLSIKYAKYLTHQRNANALPSKSNLPQIPIISLDTEINNFHSIVSFISKEEFRTSYARKKMSNILLQSIDFDYESLTLNSELNNDHGDFEDMFNIMWWRNLRLGNWNFFLNALRERTENVTYVAQTGVSGVISMQSSQNCRETEELEIEIDQKKTKAPAFIYTYLTSVESNIDEDFVVVAYNTPFYTSAKEPEICRDMCREIEWLSKGLFGQTHLMPVYGVVICCRPHEVVHKLENFPYAKYKAIVATTETSISEETQNTDPEMNYV